MDKIPADEFDDLFLNQPQTIKEKIIKAQLKLKRLKTFKRIFSSDKYTGTNRPEHNDKQIVEIELLLSSLKEEYPEYFI